MICFGRFICMCIFFYGCKAKVVEITNETYFSKGDSTIRLEKYYKGDTLISVKTLCNDLLVEQFNYQNNAVLSYYFYSKNGLCYSRVYDRNKINFTEFGSPCFYGYITNSDKIERKTNSTDSLKFYFFTPNIFGQNNQVFLNYNDSLFSVFTPVSDIPGLFFTVCNPRNEGLYEDCFSVIIKDNLAGKEYTKNGCLLFEVVK